MSFSERKLCKLGDLVESISEKFDSTKEEVVLINTSDVYEGKVLNHEFVRNEGLKGQFKKSFHQHDILYSEIRPANKRFAYVDFNSEDYVASTKLMVLRKKCNSISSHFLFQILKSEYVINTLQMLAESRSGTFPQITYSELARLEVILPPPQEQQAIAHTLSTLDEKIQVNHQINKTLEAMAQAIFKQWFIDFEFPNENGEPYKSSGGEMVESELGLIPKGWILGNISDILIMNYGKSLPAKKRKHGKINVYSSAGNIDLHDTPLVDKEGIIVGRKGTIGTVYYEPNPFFCIDTAYFITPDDCRGLVHFSFQLLKFLNLAQYNEDSAVPGLNRSTVYAINIAIPENSVTEKGNAILGMIRNHICTIEMQNKHLISLRDTLLPKLMSGEIRVPIQEN